MNLSKDRFLYGILGAFLGACLAAGVSLELYGILNFRAIIIVSAVSFVVFILWGYYIIDKFTDFFPKEYVKKFTKKM